MPPWRIVTVLAAVGFLATNIYALFSDLRTSRLIRLAAAIEDEAHLPQLLPETKAALVNEIGRFNGCGRRASRSVVTISLFLLRRSVADGDDIDTRSLRFEQASLAVWHALACSPTNGHLWITAAWLDRLAAYEPTRFRRLLDLSIVTAPAEGRVLEERWNFISPFITEIQGYEDAVVRNDLVNDLRYAKPLQAGVLMRRLAESGADHLLNGALESVSRERQLLIEKAVPEAEPPIGDESRLGEAGIAPS